MFCWSISGKAPSSKLAVTDIGFIKGMGKATSSHLKKTVQEIVAPQSDQQRSLPCSRRSLLLHLPNIACKALNQTLEGGIPLGLPRWKLSTRSGALLNQGLSALSLRRTPAIWEYGSIWKTDPIFNHKSFWYQYSRLYIAEIYTFLSLSVGSQPASQAPKVAEATGRPMDCPPWPGHR